MSKQQNSTRILISGLLVLVVAYGIVLSLRNTSEKVRAITLDEYQAALKESKFSKAQLMTEEYATLFRATDLLAIPPFQRRQVDQLERERLMLEQIGTLLEALQQKPIDSTTVEPLILVLAQNSENTDLSPLVKEMYPLQEKLLLYENELKQNTQTEEGIWSRITLLKNDFRELLQLPIPTEEQEESIELYRKGFLSGLPIVPELETPPETSRELADRLNALQVPLPSLTAQEFNQRLSNLRISLSQTIQELDRNNERNEELSEALKNLGSSLATHYQDIREQLLMNTLTLNKDSSMP